MEFWETEEFKDKSAIEQAKETFEYYGADKVFVRDFVAPTRDIEKLRIQGYTSEQLHEMDMKLANLPYDVYSAKELVVEAYDNIFSCRRTFTLLFSKNGQWLRGNFVKEFQDKVHMLQFMKMKLPPISENVREGIKKTGVATLITSHKGAYWKD